MLFKDITYIDENFNVVEHAYIGTKNGVIDYISTANEKTDWGYGEVYDGRGKLLLTRRAPGKSFAGTWENSGGAAKAGETSLQAIRRELYEETGIRAEESEFELLESGRDKNTFYDFYCLYRPVALEEIRLLPGETDNVMWASFGKVHWMIRTGKICKIIAHQFLRQEKWLRLRSLPKDRA